MQASILFNSDIRVQSQLCLMPKKRTPQSEGSSEWEQTCWTNANCYTANIQQPEYKLHVFVLNRKQVE